MATTQLDNVREGAETMKIKSSAAGTDGGWIHTTPLKTRYSSPTGLMSFDGESAWTQYDPHMLVPKEWGKQVENWSNSLRDWPDPNHGMWQTGQAPTWKSVNYRRWPLHRVPRYVLSQRGVLTLEAFKVFKRVVSLPILVRFENSISDFLLRFSHCYVLHLLCRYDRSGIDVNL